MTSRAGSNGMPLRISLGFPDPGLDSRGQPSDSRLERTYTLLLFVYRLVHIVYWLVVGGFLMLFPSQPLWENNYLVLRYPALHALIVNPMMKGAVWVLGMANLLIGFQEIAHLLKGHGSSVPR